MFVFSFDFFDLSLFSVDLFNSTGHLSCRLLLQSRIPLLMLSLTLLQLRTHEGIVTFKQLNLMLVSLRLLRFSLNRGRGRVSQVK